MPLQSQELVMVGLGIKGDAPPSTSIQPPLVDGIHLRWAFEKKLGFPWYGFYLFRRNSIETRPICLSPSLINVQPGTLNTGTMTTQAGTVSSDCNLVLVHDPTTGQVEFDLAGRKYLRFSMPPDQTAHWVRVTVGFRNSQNDDYKCFSFLDRPLGYFDNSSDKKIARFTVFRSKDIVELKRNIASVDTVDGALHGLDCRYMLQIDLPEPVNYAELYLTSLTSQAEVVAFNVKGERLDSAQMGSVKSTPERHTLCGIGITSVQIRSLEAVVFLHEVSYGMIKPVQGNVRVTAFMGVGQVAEAVLSSNPVQVCTATLESDAITHIVVSADDALLIDVCYRPVLDGATSGWKPLSKSAYPLCLPVTHPDYPATGKKPVDLTAAQGEALGRVLYGPSDNWADAFSEPNGLYDQLVYLVSGGPGGLTMAEKIIPPPSSLPETDPQMPDLYSLDMVLLAALDPAVAQIIGLYWVDQRVDDTGTYDYLIVADYTGVGYGNPGNILAQIQTTGFGDLYAYIVFNKRKGPAAPLLAPVDPRVYALPGGPFQDRDGNPVYPNNSAGLRWDLGLNRSGTLDPYHSIMYHIWRSDLGNDDQPHAGGPFTVITRKAAVIVGKPPASQAVPQRSPDWPPFSLYYINNRLADGWYAYQVSGVDIFGRHSPNSAVAPWYEWVPRPDPAPWYYEDPAGDRAIRPDAIRLLDKIPPQPPTGIEAYALDPADPTVIKDPVYDAWFSGLSEGEKTSVIGLRVSWNWTLAHKMQAPDTREFRIYYHPGMKNALPGRTSAVAAAGNDFSDVTTDIPNTYPAGAYNGAWLRIGTHNFQVVDSYAGTPLKVKVNNVGFTYVSGTLSVNKGSAILNGYSTGWHAGMVGLSLQVSGDQDIYTILSVEGQEKITLDRLYAKSDVQEKAYCIFSVRPSQDTPCVLAIPAVYNIGTVSPNFRSKVVNGVGTNWNVNLEGQSLRVEGHLGIYRIISVDSLTQLTLNRQFTGDIEPGKVYYISHPLFIDFSRSENWQERYYVVDYDKYCTDTKDSAGRWLRHYEVLLPVITDSCHDGLPLAPTLQEPIVYAHIGVSAADGQEHTLDNPKWPVVRWGGRSGNEGSVGSPATIFRVKRDRPPSPELPPYVEPVYATRADYLGRSYYTYRWKPSPSLKTHISRAMDDSIFKVDWGQRPRQAPLSASDNQYFPAEITVARRSGIAAELNQLDGYNHDDGLKQAMIYYNLLPDDSLRVLAGLPGNDRAFSQITIQPLDSLDSANDNRVGPDNPLDLPIDTTLCAYIDTLDGRSTNRYFYRSAYVDSVHNRSLLSLSGPPVYLWKVTPPRAPAITKVIGGDRQITLKWASNRESDLLEYRIFRADTIADARDLRLMTSVHTEPVPHSDPLARPSEIVWTDQPVPGLVMFIYRIVAVDETGNISMPSQLYTVRAFDEERPVPPTWNPIISSGNGSIIISWSSTILDLRCLVERHLVGAAIWENQTGWLARGLYTFTDSQRTPGVQYIYRLRVMTSDGKLNNTYLEMTA